MKKLLLLLALPVVLGMQNGFAQIGAHLTLSDVYPSARENHGKL